MWLKTVVSWLTMENMHFQLLEFGRLKDRLTYYLRILILKVTKNTNKLEFTERYSIYKEKVLKTIKQVYKNPSHFFLFIKNFNFKPNLGWYVSQLLDFASYKNYVYYEFVQFCLFFDKTIGKKKYNH